MDGYLKRVIERVLAGVLLLAVGGIGWCLVRAVRWLFGG